MGTKQAKLSTSNATSNNKSIETNQNVAEQSSKQNNRKAMNQLNNHSEIDNEATLTKNQANKGDNCNMKEENSANNGNNSLETEDNNKFNHQQENRRISNDDVGVIKISKLGQLHLAQVSQSARKQQTHQQLS